MADFIERDEMWGDQWTLAYPRSPEELATIRARSVAVGSQEGLNVPDGFECDTCVRAPICLCVFDLYNTPGDCLWEK